MRLFVCASSGGEPCTVKVFRVIAMRRLQSAMMTRIASWTHKIKMRHKIIEILLNMCDAYWRIGLLLTNTTVSTYVIARGIQCYLAFVTGW